MASIESVDAEELQNRLSWSSGTLIFSGEPLEEVVKEISRYTTMTIDIADPALNQVRVAGRFPAGKTELALRALETNFGVRIKRLNRHHVVLSAAGG